MLPSSDLFTVDCVPLYYYSLLMLHVNICKDPDSESTPCVVMIPTVAAVQNSSSKLPPAEESDWFCEKFKPALECDQFC